MTVSLLRASSIFVENIALKTGDRAVDSLRLKGDPSFYINHSLPANIIL